MTHDLDIEDENLKIMSHNLLNEYITFDGAYHIEDETLIFLAKKKRKRKRDETLILYYCESYIIVRSTYDSQ